MNMNNNYKRLLTEAFGMDGIELTELIIMAADKAMSELTEHEEKIVRYYYGLNTDTYAHTLDETGTEFGVTRERIRQILAKASRKLRHPARFQYIKFAMSSNDIFQLLFDTCAKIKALEARCDVLQERVKILTEGNDAANELIYGMSIEELNLSIRAYNCLLRAGIYTVGDLIGINSEELINVHKLGKKSYIEIAEIMNANFGTNFATDDNTINNLINQKNAKKKE
jgi:hypothetical protein